MAIKLQTFGFKQKQILTWWHPKSSVHTADGIIADGSIRAGKTVAMAIGFIEWAFYTFNDQQFAICGKTVGSLRRNVIFWLKPILELRGYKVDDRRTENKLIITKFNKINTFYIFGGRDESSQDLIQGVTLAGLLLDEVALMPESFVNQATGRCSVTGAKFWFNCNPDHPFHWFKENWLDKRVEKNLIHLHFTMEDNPSLDEHTKKRYYNLYLGTIFYQRFILGLWVMAEGAIYDMWREDNIYDEIPVVQGIIDAATVDVCVDYGTINPMAFLKIIDTGSLVLVDEEYYYDSKKEYTQKTDEQYAQDFDLFTGGPEKVRLVILDPSAASFRAVLRQRGYRLKEADNEVNDGIRLVSTVIGQKILLVNRRCTNLIREFSSYVWDTKLSDKGKEQPVKANDHALDALRYWIKTIFKFRGLRDR